MLRLCKGLVLLLCVIGTVAYGQKRSKTYKEVFNSTPETVLDLNTTHADIQFETWNKDQIAIEATIVLEGASEDEARAYFEKNIIKIIGNSQQVSVSTGREHSGLLTHSNHGFEQLHFDNGFKRHISHLMDDMDHFSSDSLFIALDMIDDMPPLPKTNFDYQAFQKYGDEYLKKWKAEFDEGFGKEYQKRMEEWTRKNEARMKKLDKKRATWLQKAEERAEEMEKRAEEREERLRFFRWHEEDTRDQKKKEGWLKLHGNDSTNFRFLFTDSLSNTHPNIFYFSSDGQHKNYKVKKTIKIKMPKGTKIKMNVRHGEVKLAANTKNINAKLSYATLHAFEIDGENTDVVASYSPVSVAKWNFGQLRTHYSEQVNLQEVGHLRLAATSSDVTIERLLDKAFIKNDFGPVTIKAISKDFTDLDISLQNAELWCTLPETPFTIYVNGTSSKFLCPSELQLERTKNHHNVVHKGHYRNRNGGKSIVINSKYSEVVLD